MKSKIKSAMLLFSGVAILAVPAMAAVTLENGSMALAFYQLDGGGVPLKTYVYDLGQSANYRENTLGGFTSISGIHGGVGVPASSNINTDLVSAFGANWASDSSVVWMAVGNINQGTGPITGDPGRTAYYSLASTGAANPTFTGSDDFTDDTVRIPASNTILTFFSGVVSKTAGNNADGAIIPSSAIKTVDEYVNTSGNTVNPGTFFTLGTDITQTISGGGALDVFRVLHTTSGADLSVGASLDASQTGVAQYIGSFTLDNLGNVKFGTISAVPEPSGTLALGIVGGLAGLGYRSRRKK